MNSLMLGNGRGVLEENDVYENDGSGVVIRSNGNPTMRRNKIHHGKKNGVYVYMDGEEGLKRTSQNQCFYIDLQRSQGLIGRPNGPLN